MGMKYDVIIPLAKKDLNFVKRVVEYIRRNFDDAQTIYLITNSSFFTNLRKLEKKYSCILIDENKMIDGLTFNSIKKIVLRNNQRAGITGHYFQQFLKMGFSLTPYCKDYYLSWDSDCIPLSHIDFFKEDKPLFSIKTEYRQRYFDVMKQVWNIDKQINGSFIAEHMMFKGAIMRELIAKANMNDKSISWFETIINCTDKTKVDENIMSEFEFYGNYCMVNYPDLYGFHELKSFRHAGIIRGRHISKRLLSKLSYDLDMATFEIYDSPFSVAKIKYLFRNVYEVLAGYKLVEWPGVILKIIKGNYKHQD